MPLGLPRQPVPRRRCLSGNALLRSGRGQRDRRPGKLGPRSRSDPRAVEQVLGQPDPTRRSHHESLLAGRSLGAHAAVADLDDPVGDRGRADVVAHDQRRRTVLAREVADQRVDALRRRRVELAGRLVRKQEPWAVDERGTERDTLLLTTRKLRRTCVGAIAETDALEQPSGARTPFQRRLAPQSERQLDDLPDRELRREQARIVLVDVADRLGSEPVSCASAQPPEVDTVDAHEPRGWGIERGDRSEGASSCPTRSGRRRRRSRPRRPRARGPGGQRRCLRGSRRP